MWLGVALRDGGLASRALLMVGAAAVLAGCSAHSAVPPPTAAVTGSVTRAPSRASIPLPDQALLKPQPEPACEYKAGSSGQPDPEAQRVKLDYERQCYRHAELLVRARLKQLQDAVAAMIKTARSQ